MFKNILIDTGLLFINRVERMFENYRVILDYKGDNNLYLKVSDPTNRTVGLSIFFPTTHLTGKAYMDVYNFFFRWQHSLKKLPWGAWNFCTSSSDLNHLRSQWSWTPIWCEPNRKVAPRLQMYFLLPGWAGTGTSKTF